MKLQNKVNNSVIEVPSEHGQMLVEQGAWEVFIEKKENTPSVVEQVKKGPGRPRKE